MHQRFKKTALRAVIPLIPPALSPPAKALGAKGSQAVFLYSVSAFMSVHQRSGLVLLANISVHQRFKKTALRAVSPLIPPALSPPVKALGAKGSQAVFLYSVSAFMSVHQRSGFLLANISVHQRSNSNQDLA